VSYNLDSRERVVWFLHVPLFRRKTEEQCPARDSVQEEKEMRSYLGKKVKENKFLFS